MLIREYGNAANSYGGINRICHENHMHVENKTITLTPYAFQLEASYVLEEKKNVDLFCLIIFHHFPLLVMMVTLSMKENL